MDARELNDGRTPANERQVGGDHYKRTGGEEHWDRIWRLYGRGYFVGCITKYVERYQLKNGMRDLEKAQHFLQKLMELEARDQGSYATQTEWNRGNGLMSRVTLPADPPPLPEGHGSDGVDWPYAFRPPVRGHPLTLVDPHLGVWVGDFEPLVKPTGWVGYTFEGAVADECMYRCTKCKERFTVSVHLAPGMGHTCRGDAPAGDATPAYVDQDGGAT